MKSDFDKEIIERIRALRKEFGVSQRGIARVIGTAHNFPQQVEDFDSPCKYSAEQIYFIAQYFMVPVSTIYPDLDTFPPKLEMADR